MASLPKRIVVPPNETTRQEILDAEFERGFVAEGLRRLRFSSSQERRQLEESYARRLAERFDADAVVLASVGELSGADWLNARLYLRSGYLNRQGLVRLEPQRANALGRFLATGKDVPGVLRPEEAGALVAASRPVDSAEPEVDPWYTDIAGWTFLGGGLVTLGFGRWINSGAEDKQDQADAIRNDTERQNAPVPRGPEREILGRRAHRGRPAGIGHRRRPAAGPRIQPLRRAVHLPAEHPPRRRRSGRRRPVLTPITGASRRPAQT